MASAWTYGGTGIAARSPWANTDPDLLQAINGDTGAQERVRNKDTVSGGYNGFDPSSLAAYILSGLNLSDPSAYLQSAWDIANLNTMTSESMAREQNAWQEVQNAKAMDFNATEAQKVRDWEELMSSTAHQREVQDLIKAGLNPVLSANQGASTPNAANATGVTSSGAKGSVDTSMVGAMMSVYTKAMDLKMQEKQIDAQLAMNVLNNETTRYAADRGAYGAVTAAGLNSSAARYSADINKMIYEEGWHGLGSVLGNVADSGIDTILDLIGSNNPSEAVINMIEEMFPWTKTFLDPQPKTGRTVMNQNDGVSGSGYHESGRNSGIRQSK